MCLSTNSEKSSSTGYETRSIVGLGALMLLACLAGPAIAGATSAIGLGILAGAGGVGLALALCAAVPVVALARRRRARRNVAARES